MSFRPRGTYAVASPKGSVMMGWRLWLLAPGTCLLVLFASCQGGVAGEPLTCISDNDCPPECNCDAVPSGFCRIGGTGSQCGGSCTRETCSMGESCERDRIENSVVFFACLPDGSGGTSGTGGSAGTGGVGGQGGGGSAGVGGSVDPCAIELPSPAGGLKVDVYAVLEIMPAGISFAADGTLFIGTNSPEQTSPVFRVSPDGSTLNQSPEDFMDPDALIVDIKPLVATTAGNVLIGGSVDVGGNTGQLLEMTPEGNSVGDPLLNSCLRNINHLFFDVDDRLIATNYNLLDSNVCAVLPNRSVINLIPNVAGDGPAGLTVQDPSTKYFYVSVEGSVHRYDSDGGNEQENYITEGSAMSYGPQGSPFEGLLIRRSGQLLVRRDPASTTEDLLLTGRVGSFHAFYPNGQDANLYISDPPGLRVLRVSLESKNLEPTKKPVGCADP